MAIQRGYPDLHDHVANLEKEGLLLIARSIIGRS